MKYVKVMLLLLLGLGAKAQTEVNLGDFNAIEIEDPIQVKLIAADKAKASHSKDLNAYEFEIKGGVLEIELRKNLPASSEPLLIYFVNLNQLELNGTAAISTEKGSEIKGETFEIECNGAAKVNLNIAVKKLVIESSGVSKITLEGTADTAMVELTGASKFFASNLLTKQADLESSGASQFEIFASEHLSVEASGATKGSYAGNPITRNINVSGVANIVDATTGKSMKDEREKHDDTTRIAFGKKKFIIIDEGDEITIEKDNSEGGATRKPKKKGMKSVYTGFELGMGGLNGNQLGKAIPNQYDFLKTDVSKSWFYGLNLFEKDLQIVRNKLALTTGFGMEFQTLEFNTDRILIPNSSQVSADSGYKSMTRNRMYNFNISVPLLLKFAPRTAKTKNGFHLAAGIIGSYKAFSQMRLESTANGYNEKLEIRDDFNINPFRLTGTVRVGYGWFRAFANYNLTPYFNTSNGNPDVRTFTAGLTLVSFD
jgi:hypothetical protein